MTARKKHTSKPTDEDAFNEFIEGLPPSLAYTYEPDASHDIACLQARIEELEKEVDELKAAFGRLAREKR